MDKIETYLEAKISKQDAKATYIIKRFNKGERNNNIDFNMIKEMWSDENNYDNDLKTKGLLATISYTNNKWKIRRSTKTAVFRKVNKGADYERIAFGTSFKLGNTFIVISKLANDCFLLNAFSLKKENVLKYQLGPGPYTIGSRGVGDIIINDNGISAPHCIIIIDNNEIRLKDWKSTKQCYEKFQITGQETDYTKEGSETLNGTFISILDDLYDITSGAEMIIENSLTISFSILSESKADQSS